MPISRFRRVGTPPTARAATRALRARAIMVIAVAAIFSASLLASGAANAASAGGAREEASASLAPSPAGSDGFEPGPSADGWRHCPMIAKDFIIAKLFRV